MRERGIKRQGRTQSSDEDIGSHWWGRLLRVVTVGRLGARVWRLSLAYPVSEANGRRHSYGATTYQSVYRAGSEVRDRRVLLPSCVPARVPSSDGA